MDEIKGVKSEKVAVLLFAVIALIYCTTTLLNKSRQHVVGESVTGVGCN